MKTPRIITDAAAALSLLTIIPTKTAQRPGPLPGTAAWFPAVGLALGAAAWGPLYLMSRAGWSGRGSLVAGALVMALWAVLTRMLHWDGLADVADGLWGGHTPSRRLEIMSDSAVGSFGAAALVLTGSLMVASVGALVSSDVLIPLIAVPALARLSATCAAWLGRPAREGGLGRSIMGRPSWVDVVTAATTVTVVAVLCSLTLGIWGLVLAAAGIVLALVVPHLLSGPVGGVTGDIMGASVLLCEAALLAIAAIVWGS